jgi:DNA-binding transcriptional MerR regulator
MQTNSLVLRRSWPLTSKVSLYTRERWIHFDHWLTNCKLNFLDIRQLIHDRDEMESTAPGTVATVELSQKIRQSLKEVRTDAAQLDKLQKDEKTKYIKKNKQNEEVEKEIEHRYDNNHHKIQPKAQFATLHSCSPRMIPNTPAPHNNIPQQHPTTTSHNNIPQQHPTTTPHNTPASPHQ